MTERYQFHFRHILKDGTVLKEGEKLPVTPASQAAFAKVARILIEARKWKSPSSRKGEEVRRPRPTLRGGQQRRA
ncbi:hypothetical protein FYJ78_12250 [Selenomonas sp. WCA-380-WT-3B 3/]|uniref:Uncharacterized protein n=1 Tax=Selenomonas montiformis TaxID=2652285 RepID=A0A6I2UZQ1_9FIRM|nr:hypothetical protein [Selenomonas montiformis]MSV25919.1 hypothetical protein [Selenomonas montiformis]